jgi:hypothetical protein
MPLFIKKVGDFEGVEDVVVRVSHYRCVDCPPKVSIEHLRRGKRIGFAEHDPLPYDQIMLKVDELVKKKAPSNDTLESLMAAAGFNEIAEDQLPKPQERKPIGDSPIAFGI